MQAQKKFIKACNTFNFIRSNTVRYSDIMDLNVTVTQRGKEFEKMQGKMCITYSFLVLVRKNSF